MIEIIGFIGAAGIVASWIPQTIRTIKTKKSGLDLKFNLVYIIAVIFMVIYSLLINDIVFIVLNILAVLLASINFYYTINPG